MNDNDWRELRKQLEDHFNKIISEQALKIKFVEITDEEIDKLVDEYGNKHPCKEWGMITNPGCGFKNGMKYMRSLIKNGVINVK